MKCVHYFESFELTYCLVEVFAMIFGHLEYDNIGISNIIFLVDTTQSVYFFLSYLNLQVLWTLVIPWNLHFIFFRYRHYSRTTWTSINFENSYLLNLVYKNVGGDEKRSNSTVALDCKSTIRTKITLQYSRMLCFRSSFSSLDHIPCLHLTPSQENKMY